jgi:HlyD family secretion protein
MTAQVSIVTSDRPDALRAPNAALRYRPPGDGPDGERGGGRPPATPAAPGVQRARAADATAIGRAERAPGGREGRVYRLEDGRPAAVPVQVGITDGRFTEILSGLSEGDLVIVGDSSAVSAPQRTPGPRRGPF